MKEDNAVINPALMLAISRMRENNTKETEQKMLMEAVRAKFLVPCDVIIKEGTENAPKRDSTNTEFKFPMVQTEQGIRFFVAFTDGLEMGKWKEGQQNAMVMGFDDLSGMVMRAGDKARGVVINPATTNLILSNAMLKVVMDHKEDFTEEGE